MNTMWLLICKYKVVTLHKLHIHFSLPLFLLQKTFHQKDLLTFYQLQELTRIQHT